MSRIIYFPKRCILIFTCLFLVGIANAQLDCNNFRIVDEAGRTISDGSYIYPGATLRINPDGEIYNYTEWYINGRMIGYFDLFVQLDLEDLDQDANTFEIWACSDNGCCNEIYTIYEMKANINPDEVISCEGEVITLTPTIY